jgi:hypothetical protein
MPVDEDNVVSSINNELIRYSPTTQRRIIEKVILAALGSIPWVGGFFSTMATLKTEEGSVKTDNLQTKWLQEHENKLRELLITLSEIDGRFNSIGDEIEERITSEDYLKLVRKSFKVWDDADTQEKRKYVANLLSNAAGTRLCSDDVVRLFIEWIRIYHELHFAVIRIIFSNQGFTRYDIWAEMYGEELPREDSAEADLFKFVIRELSTGGVIRQARSTTEGGQFLKKRPAKNVKQKNAQTMESAFEGTKQYLLTGLGKQFVHYTMNELVQRIES